MTRPVRCDYLIISKIVTFTSQRTIEFISVYKKIQLACSDANDRRFFRFRYSRNHFSLKKQEDAVKGKLELETAGHMKNCINFIRRHEICRV